LGTRVEVGAIVTLKYFVRHGEKFKINTTFKFL
jgi:hypothetical protein